MEGIAANYLRGHKSLDSAIHTLDKAKYHFNIMQYLPILTSTQASLTTNDEFVPTSSDKPTRIHQSKVDVLDHHNNGGSMHNRNSFGWILGMVLGIILLLMFIFGMWLLFTGRWVLLGPVVVVTEEVVVVEE